MTRPDSKPHPDCPSASESGDTLYTTFPLCQPPNLPVASALLVVAKHPDGGMVTSLRLHKHSAATWTQYNMGLSALTLSLQSEQEQRGFERQCKEETGQKLISLAEIQTEYLAALAEADADDLSEIDGHG